jgi:hypothetical protein
MTDHDSIIEMKMELAQLREEVDELEKKVSYYDRLALKWGGACMGAIVIGALISSQFQKIFEKILAVVAR